MCAKLTNEGIVMSRIIAVFAILPAAALVVGLTGCATTPMDRTQAQASTETPVSTQVPIASVPYDPNLPVFVVAVEPFDYSASGTISGGGQAGPAATGAYGGTATTTIGPDGTVSTTWSSGSDPDIGPGLAAQLVTALTRCGNVSVLDYDALTRNADGTYTCKLQEGEVGPFVIKGTVTEFVETADAVEKKRGASLGVAGAIVGITGAVTGNRDVAAVGGGVAAANPTFRNEEARRTGMVGMDLQLVDGATARIVRGYTAHGSFTTISKTSGASVFGIGGSDSEFAASALGQATRAAMNDALVQTVDGLRVVAARR
jgi:curli biogenesis system outer membrane secretion channel CsgG